jgi:hypothetical protein
MESLLQLCLILLVDHQEIRGAGYHQLLQMNNFEIE